MKPTSVDVGAMGDKLTNLGDEQNKGEIIGFSGAVVSTLSSGGNTLTDEQKELQASMTGMVSRYQIK